MDDVTPEGGLDPIGDKWKPAPFMIKACDGSTYVMEWKFPKMLKLNQQYEAMVHDELLRHAHRDGAEITGQILITERDVDDPGDGEGKPTKDETKERDATVFDAAQHPEKEAEIAEEQEKLPIKMSEAEIAFRKRLRGNVAETAEQAFGFVQGQLDGRDLPNTDRKFQVDRKAFMEGFFGGGAELGISRAATGKDFMIVRAEAMVSLMLGPVTPAEDPEPETVAKDDAIDAAMADFEVPDDLSGLDET